MKQRQSKASGKKYHHRDVSHINLDTLKEEVQKNTYYKLIAIIVTIILSVTAAFAGIISNLTTIENFMNTTFFPNQMPLKNIEDLAPGVNIGSYENIFGVPTYLNQNKVLKTKEYIFVNTYFYLDAVTDTNDEVLYFAVTIRDATFNPVFKSPGYRENQPIFQITLGISTFNDVDGLPKYIDTSVGAHYFSYYETRFYGNPGDYEEFGFGLNEAGYIPNIAETYIPILDKIQDHVGNSGYSENDLETLKDFRTKISFNTYAVSAPGVSLEDYNLANLGVDYYQVRTLNP